MGRDQIENKASWLVGGGIFASFIASLCCIGPLILTILGVSGAAALSKLEAVRVPMILLVLAFFGIAGFSLYRKRNSCEPGSICSDPKKFRKMVAIYWVGLSLALLGVTSPYWIAFIFS